MISQPDRTRINSFSHSPVRLKVNANKLPIDFFKKTCSYRIKNSNEANNNKINQNPATPMFGKRKNR
jgi:hypothetical protein